MKSEISVDQFQKELSDFLLVETPYRKTSLSELITSPTLTDISHQRFIEERLNIYKNNFYHSLTEALSKLYPVVKRVVGDKFFSMLAKLYIHRYPPNNPVISLYGKSFPSFIAKQECCLSLPYLSDLAKLEGLCHSVLHAKDESSLTIAHLTKFTDDQLRSLNFNLPASVQLLSSAFPVADIWLENQKLEVEEIDITTSSKSLLLIYRKQFTVQLLTLRPDIFHFVSLLASQQSLGDAWSCTAEIFKLTESDFPGIFSYLLKLGIFSEISLTTSIPS